MEPSRAPGSTRLPHGDRCPLRQTGGRGGGGHLSGHGTIFSLYGKLFFKGRFYQGFLKVQYNSLKQPNLSCTSSATSPTPQHPSSESTCHLQLKLGDSHHPQVVKHYAVCVTTLSESTAAQSRNEAPQTMSCLERQVFTVRAGGCRCSMGLCPRSCLCGGPFGLLSTSAGRVHAPITSRSFMTLPDASLGESHATARLRTVGTPSVVVVGTRRHSFAPSEVVMSRLCGVICSPVVSQPLFG